MNETIRKKINDMFNRIGITDFRWDDHEIATAIIFREEGAESFFKYVGDSLPDFDYKWR